MGERIIHFFKFWSKRKALFFLLLTIVCSVLFYGVLQLKINQSIYSILPKGERFESLNKLISNKGINDKVLFLIDINENQDEEIIRSLLKEAEDSLNKECSNYLKDITALKESLEDEVYSYYYSQFPLLIDSTYYENIDHKTSSDSISKSLKSVYENLTSPSGVFLKKYLINDPLFISSKFFKSIETIYENEQMDIENDIIYSKDHESVFLYSDIKNNNLKSNELLYSKLNQLKENWNIKHANNQIDYFGSFQISVENSLQVKKDTTITISITIFAILLILLLYYRKITVPIFFILPALFGALFSLGCMGYIHPNVSGLSLATGAILFGIILDYSFHFFTHLEHTKSLIQTLKEVSSPLITGCLTTVLAFGALIFANSVILQDFGIFAALALAGSALFTLFALPVILELFSFKFSTLSKKRKFPKLPPLSKKLYFPSLLLIFIVTIFMYFISGDVQFDDDISHLSYHKTSLKVKESKFVGINPDKQKKVYLFSKGKNTAQTLEINYKLIQELKKLKKTNKIFSFNSTGDFLIPEKVKERRLTKWSQYWNLRSPEAFESLDSLSTSFGFNENVFNQFKSWTTQYNIEETDSLLLDKLEISNLLNYDNNNKLTILSTINVGDQNIPKVKSQLEKIPGVTIFNRKDMATSLVEIVKKDFNYLLYISVFIVFIVLLIIYGRIELTLLALLPMVISWIWILGFAALLDIKFNFVNIIITTFIFGLGDDFSIFVTDGLLAKYKYKKDSINSFKTAIFLSAITTIIGTGVLGFAKHPAINSIAILSVIGIACILFISLIVQPIIFNFFVQNRVNSGKAPVTMSDLLWSVFLFFIFAGGCIFSTLIIPIIILIPIGKSRKRRVCTYILSKFSWVNIYAGLHVKKKILGRENLNFDSPSIIITNHSSFLDILLMLMLNPKTVIMVKKWVYKSPLFGIIVRYAGYIYVDDTPEKNLAKAKDLIANGYSIIIYPEGSRSTDGKLKRFHKGAFLLAQELDVDITPILIHGAKEVNSKNDYIIGSGAVTLKVLPRIKNDDLNWGESYSQRTKSISKYFKAEFNSLKNKKEDASYLTKQIFNNYVYKGPLLEWYFKIKWRFEAKNYDYYNEVIKDRLEILDVGCGYGYLSYYLHYKNLNRKITAIDYDDEKIDIAKNAYNITSNLSFKASDVTKYNMTKKDVIFYNDILHYLTESEQINLLNSSVKALNPNGIILIRDGITNLPDRHEATIKTEKYSTKIIKFNKKTRDLHFFSSSFIEEFAKENNLSYEMKEQTKKTSNVLFILTKK